MGIVSGIVVFIIIWWLVFFTVLPHGNRPPEAVEEGMEPGAPAKPRLWRKAGITTLIAIVLFGAFWVINDQGWISFRGNPFEQADG